VKSVKDGDLFDHRMNETLDPLGLYKLHGCIDYYTDESIPLILSTEQYASYEQHRARFYARFRDLGHEYPIIFAGYSISDPHIQRILFDLTSQDISRPHYYLVSPHIDPIETRYWATHRVTCLSTMLADFLSSLDAAIPEIARQLPPETGGGELSIRKHYNVANASESSGLRGFLKDDVTHIRASMVIPVQNPSEFYRGNESGFGAISQNLDVKRTFADSVLVDAILVSEDPNRPSELFMVKGPAGNGKSVALKRIAWEAGITYDHIALFANGPSGIRIDPLEEIFTLTGKRTILFVDRVALVRKELIDLLRASRSRKIPITVVGAERDNEWNTYCEFLEPFLKQEFPVRYLSRAEIGDLIGLLERHNALGVLKEKKPADRIHAFTDVAERQLLVALHEATLGIAFEEIVLDEYRRIEPPVARRLYLEICALHQYGAPVRAGLISRTSGITFEQFGREFIGPLQNVVLVVEDQHLRDVYYRSRHQHVASLVFHRALPSAEEKFDLLASLIGSINVDYSSDRETFQRLIRGRGIAETFPNVELGRMFYDRIEDVAPRDPFVSHQRAVFEMSHSGGESLRAQEAARRAHELNPTSHSIQHTQGEVARRLANETDDPLKKQTLRRFAREKVGGELSRSSEYDLYTRARLAIDELREEVHLLEGADDKSPPARFVEAAKDAETAIQRGLQQFPDSAEILAAEASFRDLLEQTVLAQRALEKAFALNPRQDWLAVRLARRLVEANDLPGAQRVLETSLRDNPSSKPAHLEYGRLLMRMNGTPEMILEHLKRGFTVGDNNYEAQFWYGRELFLQGHYREATKIFADTHEYAPGRFRNRATAPTIGTNGAVTLFQGTIERFEEGYAFVRTAAFSRPLFSSRSESEPGEWQLLRTGTSVSCSVAFDRRGPRAVGLHSPSAFTN
jgi:tetratricopeptide (TPR) repeat protein